MDEIAASGSHWDHVCQGLRTSILLPLSLEPSEREREINHAKVNFRLHAMLPGIRRATNRLSLAKMSWFQFSDSLSKYIPSKSPVSYSISTFQVPRPTCSPQVTMPKSQVDKDIGVAIFLNASVVARDPC